MKCRQRRVGREWERGGRGGRERDGKKSKLVKGLFAVGFRFEHLAEVVYIIPYRKSPGRRVASRATGTRLAAVFSFTAFRRRFIVSLLSYHYYFFLFFTYILIISITINATVQAIIITRNVVRPSKRLQGTTRRPSRSRHGTNYVSSVSCGGESDAPVVATV